MSKSGKLDDERQEYVLSFIKSKGFVTYEMVVNEFDVHYMTARDWIQELIAKGLVKKYPFPQGRKTKFVLEDSDSVAGGIKAPVKFIVENESKTFGEVLDMARREPALQPIQAILSHLLTRSYFANDEDRQHLRGARTALLSRSDVRDYYNHLKEMTSVVELLLMHQVIWNEGRELADRAGIIPNTPSIDTLLDEARLYRERTDG